MTYFGNILHAKSNFSVRFCVSRLNEKRNCMQKSVKMVRLLFLINSVCPNFLQFSISFHFVDLCLDNLDQIRACFDFELDLKLSQNGTSSTLKHKSKHKSSASTRADFWNSKLKVRTSTLVAMYFTVVFKEEKPLGRVPQSTDIPFIFADWYVTVKSVTARIKQTRLDTKSSSKHKVNDDKIDKESEQLSSTLFATPQVTTNGRVMAFDPNPLRT